MKMIHALLSLCIATSLTAQPASKEISEAFGHIVEKNLKSLGIEFDIEALIQGIKSSSEGKPSPLTDAECISAITAHQEDLHKKLSEANLVAADHFMKKQTKEKNIVVKEKGKLLYSILAKGTGAEVTPTSTPLIRYKGTLLDGTVFGESKKEEPISLQEAIKGFQMGLTGMKEGEKRVVYIHPELGYGTSGALPPNSLLTFEVELVKAHYEPPVQ